MVGAFLLPYFCCLPQYTPVSCHACLPVALPFVSTPYPSSLTLTVVMEYTLFLDFFHWLVFHATCSFRDAVHHPYIPPFWGGGRGDVYSLYVYHACSLIILTYAYICTENNHLQFLATCVTKINWQIMIMSFQKVLKSTIIKP